MKELQQKSEDKIEIVKQQQKKQTLVLQKQIIYQKGHTIFEYNKETKQILVADYEPPKENVFWDEAVGMYYKVKIDKIDIFNTKTRTISKVIQRPNCIYISCLNKQNVIKILKRDYGIS